VCQGGFIRAPGSSNTAIKTPIIVKMKRTLVFVEIALHRWRRPFACCQQYGSPFAGCLLQMSPSAVALLHVAGREIDVLKDYAPDLILYQKGRWLARWSLEGRRFAGLGGGGNTY
jgi:hypothetical protein